MADKKNKTADMKEYKKKYTKTYVRKDKEKRKEHIICSKCGGTYTRWNITHHNETKKHELGVLRLENEKLKKQVGKK